MFDISQEHLIPLRDVPARLPPRPSGKRVHISACYRWASRGVRGVVLETVQIGGSTYTSKQALQRWTERLSGKANTPPFTQTATTSSRQKEIEKAQREVEKILGVEKEEDGKDSKSGEAEDPDQ